MKKIATGWAWLVGCIIFTIATMAILLKLMAVMGYATARVDTALNFSAGAVMGTLVVSGIIHTIWEVKENIAPEGDDSQFLTEPQAIIATATDNVVETHPIVSEDFKIPDNGVSLLSTPTVEDEPQNEEEELVYNSNDDIGDLYEDIEVPLPDDYDYPGEEVEELIA